jgi:hypothetical protein
VITLVRINQQRNLSSLTESSLQNPKTTTTS